MGAYTWTRVGVRLKVTTHGGVSLGDKYVGLSRSVGDDGELVPPGEGALDKYGIAWAAEIDDLVFWRPGEPVPSWRDLVVVEYEWPGWQQVFDDLLADAAPKGAP
jgi:hypothetical protein